MLNVIMFVTVYLGGIFNALFLNPAWAFILYQLIYFIYPQARWWGYMIPNISYSLTSVVLMALVLAKTFKSSNKNKILSIPQFKWAIALGLSYIVASFYAISPEAHHLATTYFIKLLIIIFIAFKLLDSDKKLNGSLVAYIVGAAYIGFITFQTGRNSGDRVEGVGTVDSPESNTIAAAIAPTIILAIYYFWVSKSQKMRALMLICSAFTANALVLINSRGAMIATAAGTGFFLHKVFFSKIQRKNQKISVFAIVLLGAIGAASIIDNTTIERIKTLVTVKSEEIDTEKESGATRFFFWIAAIDMSKDYPLGLGYKGFDIKAPEYIPDEINTGAHRNRSVHSTWLQALSEIGYHGFAALLVMLYYCFKTTNKSKTVLLGRNDKDNYFKIIAIQGAFISYLVAITFVNRLTAETLFWFVLFTGCAYNIYVLKEDSTSL